jgi:hypothetical protein
MQVSERAFDDWDDMSEDMHEHVDEHGFHLGHWNRVITNDYGRKDPSRIGFMCNKTGVVWHMQLVDFNQQNPLAKSAFKTAEGKRKYLEGLKFRFSLPRDTDRCKVLDCKHSANQKKDGFCGWCYNRYQKGMLDEDGNRILSWKERKERIRGKVEHRHLKVLQATDEDTTKNFVCTDIHITIEEVSCFRRIFVDKHVRSACQKCHRHDQRFDFLENFVDNIGQENDDL